MRSLSCSISRDGTGITEQESYGEARAGALKGLGSDWKDEIPLKRGSKTDLSDDIRVRGYTAEVCVHNGGGGRKTEVQYLADDVMTKMSIASWRFLSLDNDCQSTAPCHPTIGPGSVKCETSHDNLNCEHYEHVVVNQRWLPSDETSAVLIGVPRSGIPGPQPRGRNANRMIQILGSNEIRILGSFTADET